VPPVLAILTSDWHLSEKTPVARSPEPDWFAAQKRVLLQVLDLQSKYQCPIFIAGDIFDKWNSTPRLINFALETLAYPAAGIYAISGNHDTPNHNLGLITNSAYWTLVEAGTIQHLSNREELKTLLVTPASFGLKLVKPDPKPGLCLQVALVHDFIWTKTSGIPGADEKKRYFVWLDELKGYDVAVFGDNHKGFLIPGKDKTPTVFNCGCLIRRSSNERSYKPCVGLLRSDGSITRHYLECEDDLFLDIKEEAQQNKEGLEILLEEFAEELESLHNEGTSFKEVVRRWVAKTKLPDLVRDFILKAISDADRR